MEKNDGSIRNYDQYGHRIFIIPAEVKGFFRKNRAIVYSFLFLIFLITPWISINGNPVLLFNLSERKFSFFGILFLAHDGPLIFFVLAFLVFSLAFMTAVWGRIWCGWACPQTVFIDLVYRRVERWIEGNYLERRRLRDTELSLNKLLRTSIKWVIYFLLSSFIAHSFIAYFSGARELLLMIQGSPQENWTYFVWVSCITALLMFNFGWFREQFCMIMCPYGRFQSVLMDRDSLAIYYDVKRGEPRKGKANLEQKQGDCVSCNRCVEVCPTGIDIRNGVQMECVACTACIDACNEIMSKVKKPQNLIRYSSLSGKSRRILRPRSVVYLILILISIFGFAYSLWARKDFSALIIRSKDTPYTLIETADGPRVLNHFKIHVHNQTFVDQNYIIEIPDDVNQKGIQFKIPQMKFNIPGGSEKSIHFFVVFHRQTTAEKGSQKIAIDLSNFENSPDVANSPNLSSHHFQKIKVPMTLVGP